MVGGTIADIWGGPDVLLFGAAETLIEELTLQSSDTHERGIAMCMLAFVPLFCTGGGRVVMGLLLPVQFVML